MSIPAAPRKVAHSGSQGRTRPASAEGMHTAASGGESEAVHRLALVSLLTEHPQIYSVNLRLALPHETLLIFRQITTGFITEEEMQSILIQRCVVSCIPECGCKTDDETSSLRDAQRVLQEVVIQQILHHGHTSFPATLNWMPRFSASAFMLLRATVSSNSRS